MKQSMKLTIVAQMLTEIAHDMNVGNVPEDVESFSELHDHVDANEYGGLTAEHSDVDLDTVNALQSAVARVLWEVSQ